jgi:hypothetical protein
MSNQILYSINSWEFTLKLFSMIKLHPKSNIVNVDRFRPFVEWQLRPRAPRRHALLAMSFSLSDAPPLGKSRHPERSGKSSAADPFEEVLMGGNPEAGEPAVAAGASPHRQQRVCLQVVTTLAASGSTRVLARLLRAAPAGSACRRLSLPQGCLWGRAEPVL